MTEFAARHIGPDQAEVEAMLATVGVGSLDELIDRAVPAGIRLDHRLEVPEAGTEDEVLARLRELADRNRMTTSMLGMGYSDTITPTVILRNVLENPAWYTAYTPYQPEISQGRLEALLNFQTMVTDLTGMDLANASLLDEATAAAEAMALCRRVAKRDSAMFFVDADCHPQTIEVVATRAEPLGIKVIVGDPATGLDGIDAYGVLVQHPGTSGGIRDLAPIVEQVHEQGGLVVVAADLLALTVLEAPGAQGADVVVGSTQRFGVPLGYGGPHAAFMAVRQEHARSMPGRLVGVSVDEAGRPAHRLALQTREQHIRREKATSNICTAQVLLAVMASMYAVYHGPDGLTAIAERVHERATRLAAGLTGAGIDLEHEHFFDTVTAVVPGRAAEVVAAALEQGVNLRRWTPIAWASPSTRPRRPEHVEAVWAAFGVDRVVRLGQRRRRRFPRRPRDRVPDPSRLPRAPVRDRDAALPALAGRQGHRPRPVDDPAGLLHHEAQRHHRDDPGDVARVRHDPPVRPARPGRRLPGADRRAGGLAGRDHRLRRGVGPAQRRFPGRAGRPAGHPRLPPGPGRRPPGRVPHPVVGPRHQRRLGGHGRPAGRRRGLRRRRQRRPRRPARQGRRAPRGAGGADGDVPVDPRRVRGAHRRRVRHRPRGRWAGVPGRGQPERHGRHRPARAGSGPTCPT